MHLTYSKLLGKLYGFLFLVLFHIPVVLTFVLKGQIIFK